jgi:protein ImuA
MTAAISPPGGASHLREPRSPSDLASVWRAESLAVHEQVRASGHPALDAQLPGGGWPAGRPGGGAAGPARPCTCGSCCCRRWRSWPLRAQPGPVVLVDAPLGAVSALRWLRRACRRRAACCGCARASPLPAVGHRAGAALRRWGGRAGLAARRPVRMQLRRLHLAAQQHRRLLVVFRTPVGAARMPRRRGFACCCRAPTRLQLRILKRRGPPLDEPLVLPAHPARLAALLATRRGGMARPPATPSRAGAPASREAGHALDRAVAA